MRQRARRWFGSAFGEERGGACDEGKAAVFGGFAAACPDVAIGARPLVAVGTRLDSRVTAVSNTSMARKNVLGRTQRPWTMMAATLTAAHHGFELSSGVGLVLQPELGLGPASALWGTQIPVWIILAARGDKRWDKLLAAWSGAALAGVLVHFFLWPWKPNKLGIPILTKAEGLSSSSLPTYNLLLYVWGAASALSIIRDTRPGTRRWALVGLATLPLLRRSARHHFSWLEKEALTNPAWWNRGVTGA